MKKLFDITVTALFLSIIFLVPILTKLEPPVDYSIFENRGLAKPPVFTISGLFSGEYLPMWEKYLSDHIWKRNFAITQYTNLNMNILDKTVINNVIVLDELLIPFIDYYRGEYDFKEQAENMADKLLMLNEHIEANGGRFIYIGIPEQYSMLRGYYPFYLNNNDEKLTATENEFFFAINGKRYILY